MGAPADELQYIYIVHYRIELIPDFSIKLEILNKHLDLGPPVIKSLTRPLEGKYTL